MLKRDGAKALRRALSRSLVVEGAVTTTLPRAKRLKRDVGKLITLAGKGNLNSRRRALSVLGNDKEAVKVLFSKTSRQVRVIPLSPRRGDGAAMARVELAVNKVENEKNLSKKRK